MVFLEFVSDFIPVVFAQEATHVEEFYVHSGAIDQDQVGEHSVQPADIIEEHHGAGTHLQQSKEEPSQVTDDEDDEPEDPKEKIMEDCTETCSHFKKYLDECNERVANGSKEDCVEEFFHFLHCADVCAAPKLFAATK